MLKLHEMITGKNQHVLCTGGADAPCFVAVQTANGGWIIQLPTGDLLAYGKADKADADAKWDEIRRAVIDKDWERVCFAPDWTDLLKEYVA